MGVSLQKVCQQVFSTFYMRFLPLMFELLILLNWKMPCCKSVQLLFFKYLQFMYFHKIFFLNSELGALFTLPKHLDYFFYLTRKCLVVSLFDYYFFKYLHIQDLKKYIKKNFVRLFVSYIVSCRLDSSRRWFCKSKITFPLRKYVLQCNNQY